MTNKCKCGAKSRDNKRFGRTKTFMIIEHDKQCKHKKKINGKVK